MKNHKVIVIGLDGATFELIMPWIKRGKLINIQELMAQGSWGELESTIHPLSPQAWSSFLTGKNPGKHGIFDFTWRKPHSYEVQLTNASHRKGKSLGKILSDYGKKVGIVNVPMTYPPEKVNGFMISGMDAPGENSNFTYPKELYQEILARFGKYIIGQRLWEYSRRGQERKLLEALKEMVRLRTDVSLYLFEKEKPDFFMIVYRATDVVQHIFWKYYDANHPLHPPQTKGLENAIYEIYREVDTAIGRFRKLMDDDCSIILVSDHGAGGNSNKSIYLNSWLKSEGFLEYLKKPIGKGTVFNDRLEQYLLSMKGRLARYIPSRLKIDLQRTFPQIFDKVASISYFSHIDWSKTKAYSEEIRTNIWINLKGREPNGIVNLEEYEDLRNELIKKIYSFIDPETNKQIFVKVYKKEELYKGDFLDNAPDLILVQDQREYELVPRSSLHVKRRKPIKVPSKVESQKDTKPSGGHRLQGILIASGKYFGRKQEQIRVNIMDVAPTILYLMGCPVDINMDGKVISEIISHEFVKSHKVLYSSSVTQKEEKTKREYDSVEQEEMKKRLKSLGYL